MLEQEAARRVVRRLLRQHVVADLATLFEALETRSRMSVFRRLRDVGYRTSFTHGGRYYTLASTPRFDANGLWFFREVGFSRWRTLKETVIQLAEDSPAGLSYTELRRITTVRVENTLVELVRRRAIVRGTFRRRSVYLSTDPEKASEQLAMRSTPLETPERGILPLSLVADVLLEVVRASDVHVDPKTVVARLRARGVSVNESQVLQVYAAYGLTAEKKL